MSEAARGAGCCAACLPLEEPVEHVVREDDGLQLDARLVAVLAREHVDLALVDAELADVGLEEEDVGALHDRVEDLRGGERVLEPAHDLAAARDALDAEAARDVEALRPVLPRVLGDLLLRAKVMAARHVWPRARGTRVAVRAGE